MLTWIVVIIVIAILAVLGFAASKPGSFSVVRTTDIKAPPEKVLALINDFREWPKWSPWEKLDPGNDQNPVGASLGHRFGL